MSNETGAPETSSFVAEAVEDGGLDLAPDTRARAVSGLPIGTVELGGRRWDVRAATIEDVAFAEEVCGRDLAAALKDASIAERTRIACRALLQPGSATPAPDDYWKRVPFREWPKVVAIVAAFFAVDRGRPAPK